MYKWIYSSSYVAYLNFPRNKDPRVSAVCVVGFSHILIVVLIFALLRRYEIFDLLAYFRNLKALFLIGAMFGYLYILNAYYSQKRTKVLEERFRELTLWKRRTWTFIAFLNIVLLIVLIGMLGGKPTDPPKAIQLTPPVVISHE